MLLNKEHEVLAGFIKAPWSKLTLRQVKELSGKSSGSYVHGSLKRFVKGGLLKEERVGNTVLYRLDMGSLKTCSYLGFVAEYAARSKRHVPFSDLERIMRKMPGPYYSLLVTGSYASNKQNGGSDVDVVIICDDCSEPKKIYAELSHECDMNIPPIHLYVFKKSEFLSMLVDSKANYGKETAKNNFVLAGGREYYSILGEAIRNGFNG